MSTTDPIEALRNAIAFSSHDWSIHGGDAWLYGIVLGWDVDAGDVEPGEAPDAAMQEVAARHGWNEHDVTLLRTLHVKFNKVGGTE